MAFILPTIRGVCNNNVAQNMKLFLLKSSKRIQSALRRHGLIGFGRLIGVNIKYYATHLSELIRKNDSEFDKAFNTDTEAIREIGSLDIESENAKYAVRYQPSSASMVSNLLSELDIDYSQFSFLDFGAGKGKVLLLAGKFPFQSVIGIEFCSELQQIALDNIAGQSKNNINAKNIDCVHADVTQFPLPDGPLVLYFYNPFGEKIMRQVVNSIEQSYKNNQREIIVLYVEPALRDVFSEATVWSIIDNKSDYIIAKIIGSR